MNCKKCKLFYTENFNHFTGYCKETDRYISGIEMDCPCGKKLSVMEKALLRLSHWFDKINGKFN